MPIDLHLIYVMGMPKVGRSKTKYTLEGKTLSNGDEVEFLLGGNGGWLDVTVAGLPDVLRVTWTNETDQTLQTTVPPEAQLRWP